MHVRLAEFLTSLGDALALLREHKVRSALTILGIAVGIWSVVTLIGIGLGAKNYIEAQVQVLGSDLLVVTPGNPEDPTSFFDPRIAESLHARDAQEIASGIEHVRDAAPVYQIRGELRRSDRRAVGTMVGTTPGYFAMRDMEIARGRGLTESDANRGSAVGVIGAELADRLFGNRPALGRVVQFQERSVEVVGVLAEREDAALGDGQDTELLVPVSFVQRQVEGVQHVQHILVEADREYKDAVERSIELYLMSAKRNLARNGAAHSVTDFGEIASLAGRIVDAMTWILVSIAGVSLVVGGIGVMNVMLASVSERVSEIGIRRAVGATAGRIRMQFLGEAAMLTVVGGLIGLALAGLSLLLVAQFLPWTPELDLLIVLAVVLFSASIGGFFGYYPAQKASTLSPMEALRYD
ncbi:MULTISPECIES: ABC transporter permease [unclassified Thioalkalivibrio]|uniref:ABC transporter permease n=1 Tax=unclassified Thioalkalivibrio TaxID=2621013 RepID=UPI00037FAE7D|nr:MULTISPECIES: ABC transporter permease [unclassified Thioalkalivibrio]